MSPYFENGRLLPKTHTINFGRDCMVNLYPRGQDLVEVAPRGDVTVWLASGEKKECVVFPDESGIPMDSFTISGHSLLIRSGKTGEERSIVYSEKPVGGK